ncbi:MAG TPA: class I SAM-dependent methyltransferase [Dehalococcoidia bacterium]|nr:class I SAM-dependent methyltransferase [Dehalococcoidia bacterium]
MESNVVSSGYDAVYEAMPGSPTLRRIWKEKVAGSDYPDDFYHISFLTLPELRQLADALNLSPGSKLADLGCGMGGPGLWIAREKQAILSGVDLSAVAIAQATKRAKSLGLHDVSQFSTGTFADSGLAAASMDAAITVDALQYAPEKRAAIWEFARILRPGGRLAFTAFELAADRVVDVPVLADDPVSDYRPLLEDSGFRVLEYDQTPAWHERLVSSFQAVIDAEAVLRDEMGPVATAAMLGEMILTLERDFYRGRVFAVAERASGR